MGSSGINRVHGESIKTMFFFTLIGLALGAPLDVAEEPAVTNATVRAGTGDYCTWAQEYDVSYSGSYWPHTATGNDMTYCCTDDIDEYDDWTCEDGMRSYCTLLSECPYSLWDSVDLGNLEAAAGFAGALLLVVIISPIICICCICCCCWGMCKKACGKKDDQAQNVTVNMQPQGYQAQPQQQAAPIVINNNMNAGGAGGAKPMFLIDSNKFCFN